MAFQNTAAERQNSTGTTRLLPKRKQHLSIPLGGWVSQARMAEAVGEQLLKGSTRERTKPKVTQLNANKSVAY